MNGENAGFNRLMAGQTQAQILSCAQNPSNDLKQPLQRKVSA
jgi:hypothetical protein